MLADWHGAASGFGTVTKNLLPVFAKEFGQITLVAINYFGQPYNDGNVYVVSAREFYKPMNNEDPFGRHSFLHILANDPQGFDVCFLFQDVGIINNTEHKMVTVMAELKKHKQEWNFKNFKSVAYFPIDCQRPPGTFDGMQFFDLLITYNNYSREEVIKHRPDLKKKVKIIPHGTNTTDFYSMPPDEKQAFREQFFGANAGKVIITSVNRNQPRKNIADTIFAFIEAKKVWQNERPLFLYLHMMDKDIYMNGYDLRKIFSMTELVDGEDYMIADQKFFTESMGADIATLRGIYNASDVFVTNTLGEGHGLSISESLICRLPVVAPNHTSITEMSGNGERMYVMDELEPFCSPFDSDIRLRANVEETAEKIVLAAENRISGNDTEMLDNAEKYVRSFKWGDIANKFVEYFEEIV